MKLLSVNVKNFCSYESAHINFDDNGLTLLSGETGVGKSTAMDFVCWTLFGFTSKENAVDDVRCWFSDENTIGSCELQVNSGEIILIERIRGKINDLYYFKNVFNCDRIRGKDLKDTQKQIDELLGFDYEIYISAAYIHQFSDTDRFFDVKPKDRRQFIEQIANLKTAIKLAEKSSEERNREKNEYAIIENKEQQLDSLINKLEFKQNQLVENNNKWYKENSKKIVETEEIVKQIQVQSAKLFEDKLEKLKQKEVKSESFKKQQADLSLELLTIKRELRDLEDKKEKFQNLSHLKICPMCNSNVNTVKVDKELSKLLIDISKYKDSQVDLNKKHIELSDKITLIGDLKYEYKKIISDMAANDRLIARVEALNLEISNLMKQTNPYSELLNSYTDELKDLKEKHKIVLEKKTISFKRLQELTWLYNKSFEIRGWQMENTTHRLVMLINESLEKYFDANLRISITIVDADKIEVEINNNGYNCKYSHLSGGERALLNFVFKWAVITLIEDKIGVHFSTVMLDEVLNGLSDDLKVKAFTFLQAQLIKYENIFLIDHSEALKNLFTNKIEVTKIGNVSQLNYE